jgi:hypothetical protein
MSNYIKGLTDVRADADVAKEKAIDKERMEELGRLIELEDGPRVPRKPKPQLHAPKGMPDRRFKLRV